LCAIGDDDLHGELPFAQSIFSGLADSTSQVFLYITTPFYFKQDGLSDKFVVIASGEIVNKDGMVLSGVLGKAGAFVRRGNKAIQLAWEGLSGGRGDAANHFRSPWAA
jgi:hypothetical protein